MKKVCLIIPPSLFLLDERVFPSLGILKVASSLEAAGYPVEVLDLSGISNYQELVVAHASKTDASVFGLTATTPQMPAVHKILQEIRSVRPGTPVILGGPHPTLVHAAVRTERKRIDPGGRATEAFAQLVADYDVVVAGDGEMAIIEALRCVENNSRAFIDADDPKGPLFMTNASYEATDLPARHLIDMPSYKYSIEGYNSTSLIAQLGCLAAGTRILLSSGEKKNIEDIHEGDKVLCFDEKDETIKIAPVVKTWERDANDLFEIVLDDGSTLRITGEHPLWTKDGWKKVETCEVGTLCGGMSRVPFDFSSRVEECEILQQKLFSSNSSMFNVQQGYDETNASNAEICFLQSRMSVETREERWNRRRFEDVFSVEKYFSTRKNTSLRRERSSGEISESDRRISSQIVQQYVGREESDEIFRNLRKSKQNSSRRMARRTFSFHEGEVEDRTNNSVPSEEACSKQTRAKTLGYSKTRASIFSFCRKWRFLDRSLHIGKVSKSRFCRYRQESCCAYERRILAPSRKISRRNDRLREERVESSCRLVKRDEEQRQSTSFRKDKVVWRRIVKKEFVGPSRVFNITVCPGHSYLIDGVQVPIIVHNCPFACGFCGGRQSSMLRKIRTRSTDSIVREIEFIYQQYGHRGFMFYDDELNVNKKMVELMDAISDLQERLGIDFRLRGFVKAELFTREQAKAMYRAGFRQLLTGFESGSPRILTNINKKATREDNTRAAEIARANGLKVKALMSIGHPGESWETIGQTRDWLLEVKPDDFDCTIITTYPGTPYYDQAVETSPGIWTYTYEKTGDRLHAYQLDYNQTADYYKGDPDGGYRAYVFTDFLSAEQLVSERDTLEREVRSKLGIPFNSSVASVNYEHSMGQLGPDVLRSSVSKKRVIRLSVVE